VTSPQQEGLQVRAQACSFLWQFWKQVGLVNAQLAVQES